MSADFNGVIRYRVRKYWIADGTHVIHEVRARITAKLAVTTIHRFNLATGRDGARWSSDSKPSRLIAYRFDSAPEWVEVSHLATGDQ